MKSWWRKRSLRLRLALSFTAVASVILLGLTPAVYGLIEHRLHLEFDDELRIDWQLVSSHLTLVDGAIRWQANGVSPGDDLTHAAAWFEVWSREGKLLLRHWPDAYAKKAELEPPLRDETFRTFERSDGLAARAMESEVRVGSSVVLLRVLRDESGFHHTLREILIGFALGVPLAALLSAVGGYVMAGRTLKPITLMVERARQISSESLSDRLPNPNPHDELGQMATVFNETLQRLQESFDALKRFTADASHELRTPLTALRAVGEVGLREGSETTLRESIGSMLEEAERLHQLTDSLLLLARIESGRAPLHLELLRFDELAREVRESVGVLATEKDQEIDLSPDAQAVVKADRVLTRQAIMNILDNAIRYGPTGGRISVRSFLRGSKAGIEIIDQGAGIAPEYQKKVFERFFRVDKARSRTDGGAGLGLAIAKLSIEQQGGTIELESELGKGSTFRILFDSRKQIDP